MTDLIAQIEDPRLRARLGQEWAAATKEKKFGLVFDPHLPELLPLPGVRPCRGDLVAQRGGALTDLWRVRRIAGGVATCARPEGTTAGDLWEFPVDGLIVVRQFGEPIFPALVPLGSVQNGPADAPWHVLIEADNFHALQALDYLYAGQVDCIYIDPPYNTGARDWKYNNDYVDGNDSWRHSKWLAFMERRLRLAKRLLKPDTGVLVVTIDEHESHHLGMLLEEIFTNYLRHVVSIVINPKGTGKLNFARVDEYAIFCVPNRGKDSLICPEPHAGAKSGLDSEDTDNEESEEDADTEPDEHDDGPFPNEDSNLWELRHARRRGGESSYRHQRPNQFYPLYVDTEIKQVIRAGAALPKGQEPSFGMVDGLIPIWPIDLEGNHRCWRFVPESMQALIDTKRVVLGRYNKERDSWTVNYWVRKSESKKLKTVWWSPLHDAGTHGTILLQKLFGKRNTFPFPKSLYAVRDCIAAVVRDRPEALIIDFFAGSGTTLNAVNLLNLSDGGKRRCIQVTNNEVGDKAADHLRAIGRVPGDPEWEEQGICQAVTWPRSKFTILGRRDDGTSLPGDYLTGKTVERERPRRFVQIGFIDPATLDTPAKKRQLVALIEGLPQTLVTDPCPFIVSENHAATVLFDDAAAEDWLAALDGQDQIRDLYILTPVKRRFEALKAEAAEVLGPILVNEEERRPLAAGFPANLAWFRLDFLDQGRVALRRAFREILPLLWLKAGAIGPRPELPRDTPEPPIFVPTGNPFAVLLDEGRLADLIEALAGRTGLRILFIVTDSLESFKELTADAEEALGRHHPGLRTVQLYRDYLENFLINRETASVGTSRRGLAGGPA